MEIQVINHRTELYKLLPDNCIVAELGVAEGYNSSDICKWPNLQKLYCIDAWETLPIEGDGGYSSEWHDKNYNAAIQRLGPYAHLVTILRGITWKMAAEVEDKTLDLLYIDADHSYEGVSKDLHYWYDKVKSGGIIAGHDYLGYASVNKAVKMFVAQRGIGAINVIIENKAEDAGFYFIKP